MLGAGAWERRYGSRINLVVYPTRGVGTLNSRKTISAPLSDTHTLI